MTKSMTPMLLLFFLFLGVLQTIRSSQVSIWSRPFVVLVCAEFTPPSDPGTSNPLVP